MQKSSRILGKEIGFNAQQMNWLLKEQGYLTGVPGDYSLSDKAKPFAIEEAMHEGPGGYYDHYWNKLTFDDSIMEKLDLSEEARTRALDNLAAYRAEKRANGELAERLEKNAMRLAEEAADHKDERYKYICIILVVAACAGGAYGFYRWRKKKKADAEKKMNTNEEE